MANEIVLTCSLSAFKPTLMSSAVGRSFTGLQRDMKGLAYNQGDMIVTPAGVALPLGQIGQPHYAVLYSNPTYNNALPANPAVAITGAANNGTGSVRITAAGHGLVTGDLASIGSVTGTTEANGTWPVTVISSSQFDLYGPAFANAYAGGGTSTLDNSIRVRNGVGGADFLQLVPGDIAVIPLLIQGTPYAFGNATGQLLEFCLLSF